MKFPAKSNYRIIFEFLLDLILLDLRTDVTVDLSQFNLLDISNIEYPRLYKSTISL